MSEEELHLEQLRIAISAAERPRLQATKHVAKLLQVSRIDDAAIVSEGRRIVGVADRSMPAMIRAEFEDGQGDLYLREELVCCFRNGRYTALRRTADLRGVRQAIERCGVSGKTLAVAVENVITVARKQGHGCTLLIDLADFPRDLSGHHLESALDLTPDTNQRLASAMARIDGALQLDREGRLHSFGCLLDGPRVRETEDRSRGARYNSALRFSAQHHDSIVITVSEDGPVSVFHRGTLTHPVVLEWPEPTHMEMDPPTLERWLAV